MNLYKSIPIVVAAGVAAGASTYLPGIFSSQKSNVAGSVLQLPISGSSLEGEQPALQSVRKPSSETHLEAVIQKAREYANSNNQERSEIGSLIEDQFDRRVKLLYEKKVTKETETTRITQGTINTILSYARDNYPDIQVASNFYGGLAKIGVEILEDKTILSDLLAAGKKIHTIESSEGKGLEIFSMYEGLASLDYSLLKDSDIRKDLLDFGIKISYNFPTAGGTAYEGLAMFDPSVLQGQKTRKAIFSFGEEIEQYASTAPKNAYTFLSKLKPEFWKDEERSKKVFEKLTTLAERITPTHSGWNNLPNLYGILCNFESGVLNKPGNLDGLLDFGIAMSEYNRDTPFLHIMHCKV